LISTNFRRRIVEEELSSIFRELHDESIKSGMVPEEKEMPLEVSRNYLEYIGGIIVGGLISAVSIWIVYAFITLFYK